MVKPSAIGAVLSVMAWAGSVWAQSVAPGPEAIAIGDWRIAPVLDARVRVDYRYDLNGLNRALFLERTRLGVDVLRGPLEARVVLQDARAIELTVNDDFIEGPFKMGITGAYEAWVEAHTSSRRPSFLRIGRQPVVWGEGRLLGVADWSPAGRSIDAVRGRLVVGDAAFELLAATLEADAPGALSLDAYAALFGARAEWTFDPLFSVEVYALGRLAYYGLPPEASLAVDGQTWTGALRLHGDTQPWTWGVEGAYQLGHAEMASRFGAPDAQGVPTVAPFEGPRAAWAAAAHVAHTFENAIAAPTVRIGGAYASGDTLGVTYRAFDPLLPDVHTWHGAMDVFAWSNEVEVSGRVSAVPWTDALLAVQYRYARLAQPSDAWRSAYLATIAQVPTNTKADLGHEIDAALTWSPWVPVALDAGYSVLLLGSGARAILAAQRGSAEVSHFAYVQVRTQF